MKKGTTLFDVIFLLVFIAILAISLMIPLKSVKNKALAIKCEANLAQIGKGFQVYLGYIGRHVRYPQANGEEFVVALYKERILVEPQVYLCPGTQDSNNHGEDLAQVQGEGDSDGPCSYAGRKNKNQSQYPGIFRLTEDTQTTPIVADDWNDGFRENHEFGEVVNFLFLDGHVDHARTSKIDLSYFYDPLSN
ncbi:type II secretion system protein [Candidatus Uabimicrobium amorphum]